MFKNYIFTHVVHKSESFMLLNSQQIMIKNDEKIARASPNNKILYVTVCDIYNHLQSQR